jgi:hypothetical protein
VRHTIIRLIGDHLQRDVDPEKSWQGLNLDFTGVVFDGGAFGFVSFSRGIVQFDGAEFSRGRVSFGGAKFSGGTADFEGAKFSGGTVSFVGARFTSDEVSFVFAKFSGSVVDFSDPGAWLRPPIFDLDFDLDGTPPAGVTLPTSGPVRHRQRCQCRHPPRLAMRGHQHVHVQVRDCARDHRQQRHTAGGHPPDPFLWPPAHDRPPSANSPASTHWLLGAIPPRTRYFPISSRFRA